MSRKPVKPKRPEVTVKIALLPIWCGILHIETKYGRRSFFRDAPTEMSKEEADELIKLRTYEFRRSGRQCDLVIVNE